MQTFFGWPNFALGLLFPGLGLFVRGRRWDALAVLLGTAWASGMAALVGARFVRVEAMVAGLEPPSWNAASLWAEGLLTSFSESTALPWPLLALTIHVGAAWVAAIQRREPNRD